MPISAELNLPTSLELDSDVALVPLAKGLGSRPLVKGIAIGNEGSRVGFLCRRHLTMMDGHSVLYPSRRLYLTSLMTIGPTPWLHNQLAEERVHDPNGQFRPTLPYATNRITPHTSELKTPRDPRHALKLNNADALWKLELHTDKRRILPRPFVGRIIAIKTVALRAFLHFLTLLLSANYLLLFFWHIFSVISF